MRQYGEVPAWLSTAAAPKVSAVSGLGTGGGAGVFTADGQCFGTVEIQAGSNPSNGGSVTLVFAQQPPVMFFSPNRDGMGTLVATDNDGAHTTIVLTWSGRLAVGQKYSISYEWAVSQ